MQLTAGKASRVETAASALTGQPSDTVSSWRSESWLAPRLVLVSLLTISLSFAAEPIGLPANIILGLNLVSYIAGGFYGSKGAIEGLWRGEIDVDLLMVLAALGAAGLGEWHEGAILLFLFSLSNVMQDYAIGRSRRAIKSLFRLYPEVATVKRGDLVVEVKISEINVGDTVLIGPGERIPVDGLVIAGRSAVDESPITGESLPVDKAPGGLVFAGTLNKVGVLDVRADRSSGQSTLSRIIQLVEEAQDSKAPTQRSVDSFEQRYAKFIIFSVLLIIIVPPVLGTTDFQSNFYRAMVLMTVASPCALVISIPSALISAIASAARGGVLFKGGASLEQLADIKAVAFDKTATLTTGQPRVTDLILTPAISELDLLGAAATVEARSEHPLAQAIVDRALALGATLGEADDFTAEPGRGVRGIVDSRVIRVGRPAQLHNGGVMPDHLRRSQAALERDGKTAVAVMRDDEWLGLIALADEIRAESSALVAELRRRGIQAVMLTGDNPRVAESIAGQLGIEHVYADLLPADKSTILRQLQRDYGAVAMVGDGINDAPALAIADVGIAMGAAGTDVALEAADVVLMGDRLERLGAAINLSLRTRRVVRQNIAVSLGVIALLLLGVFAIDLPLPVGVLGHEGSTVIVVLNGLLSLLVLPEIQRRRGEPPTGAA